MAIKLIIFDLDGVLVDCKDLHYEALNKALEIQGKEVISREEHLLYFDGLNTKSKLNLLTEWGRLEKKEHDVVFFNKQYETTALIKNFKVDLRIYKVLQKLCKEFKLCVASNSLHQTVREILQKKEFIWFIDFYFGNEDVKNPKPHPEIYMKAMIKAGVSPKETLIVEDSHIGRKGAEESGAFVCPVKDSSEVTYEHIMKYANQEKPKAKWDAGNLNILIPMAGAGSRFAQAGYTFPKPLIEVNGKPMIQVVVDNLNIKGNYIFITQYSHYVKYNLHTTLNLINQNSTILSIVGGLTEGAACTALLASNEINNDTPLLIANSDQFLEWDSAEFMYSMTDNVDGGIITFKSTHPKWSFVKIEDGWIAEVAEKNPISDNATVGVYYWKKGSDFVKYANQMINKNIRTNNEFYIAPVFNEAIADGKKIKPFEIQKMWGLGTPEDLNYYENHYKCQE